jgi:hypothetical protein
VTGLAPHETRTRRSATERDHVDLSTRAAFYVFVAVEVIAFMVGRTLGRFRWFWMDEWEFLANRDLTDVADLLRPHNEHWTTGPAIVYQILWRSIGLRSYLPYQLVILTLHVTAAALLRVVMRRAGVGPWIATAAASLFALFGTGWANIVGAVQMTFVGALVLGLIHLLIADHDGPIDRRDWIGLSAGLLALMCSGVGVAMVVVVGLAVLIRRGWREAALHTVPLGIIYLAWWFSFARDEYTREVGSVGEIARFVWSGLSATFDALGQIPGVGWLLAAMLAGGLVLAWGRFDRVALRRQAAAPAALLIGAVVFVLFTAIGRAANFAPASAESSRYVGIVAALTLPALAVAADALARRWRLLAPVVLSLFVVGIPGNIDALAEHRRQLGDAHAFNRTLVLTMPRVPLARLLPRELRPRPGADRHVTVGWLRDGAKSGRIPKPSRISPTWAATATLELALQQGHGGNTGPCRNVDTPARVHLGWYQAARFDGGPVDVTYITDDGVRSHPVRFQPIFGTRLIALGGPLTLRFESALASEPVKLCVDPRLTQPEFRAR